MTKHEITQLVASVLSFIGIMIMWRADVNDSKTNYKSSVGRDYKRKERR